VADEKYWLGVFQQAVQSIPNNTQTIYTPWPTPGKGYDPSGMFNIANPERFTSKVDGLYRINHQISIAFNATGYRKVIFAFFTAAAAAAGSYEFTIRPSSVTNNSLVIDAMFYMPAGYYFRVELHQTSGISLDVSGPTQAGSLMWIARIGD